MVRRSAAACVAATFVHECSLVAADLPVHCLATDLAGPEGGSGKGWTFEFTAPQQSPFGPNGFEDRCGHSRPDGPHSQPDRNLANVALAVEVNLRPDFKAVLGNVKSQTGTSAGDIIGLLNASNAAAATAATVSTAAAKVTVSGPPLLPGVAAAAPTAAQAVAPAAPTAPTPVVPVVPGGVLNVLDSSLPAASPTVFLQEHSQVQEHVLGPSDWSMVYDEGIELEIGNLRLQAFTAFDFVDGKNQSRCGMTEVGWYRKIASTPAQASEFGCWRGYQDGYDTAPLSGANNLLLGGAADQLFEDNKVVAPAYTQLGASGAGALLQEEGRRAGGGGGKLISVREPEPDRSGEYYVRRTTTSAANGAKAKDSWNLLRRSLSAGASSSGYTYSTAAARSSTAEQQGAQTSAQAKLPAAPLANLIPQASFLQEADSIRSLREHQKIADEINSLNLGWKAKVYQRFLNKTPRQLNLMSGRKTTFSRADYHRSKRLKNAAASPAGPNSGTNTMALLQEEAKATAASTTLPASFDWRDKAAGGHPLVITEGINQGDCGSCYVISTHLSLNARLRVQKLRELQRENASDEQITAALSQTPKFAFPYALGCSETNQGCDGGYAHLVGQWGRVYGLAPDTPECTPAGGWDSSASSCQAIPKTCPAEQLVYRTNDVRYVGGRYFFSDEENIKQELFDNGPLVLGFEPDNPFMYYSEGIYAQNNGVDEVFHSLTEKDWERVDHAVLLVGWGEDAATGVKYWTLQNSWGDELNTGWGEEDNFLKDQSGQATRRGFFRFKRGENVMGMESIAECANVEKLTVDEAKTSIHWIREV